MIVEQIWTGNNARNFNYLIACEETGEALAVDPLDHEKCLQRAQDKGWTIKQVVNTHEHGDHTGGNGPVIAATGATLLAHKDAKIPGVDVGLAAGDTVKVGSSVELDCLDTPGHTMTHICLYGRNGGEPVLICGDTLFNAGVGNCHNGGHPEALYETYATQLSKLPDDTKVYPGHEYISNNLKFTLDREPDNARAEALLGEVAGQNPENPLITTLGLEKEINTFFRLTSPSVVAKLRQDFPELPEDPEPKAVFLKLRELRNKW